MSTVREFYQTCFRAERPAFVRVLKAVPPDRADYRPHPRSTSAGDLVWLLAQELHDACEVIDRGEISFVASPESIAACEHQPTSWSGVFRRSTMTGGTAKPGFSLCQGAPIAEPAEADQDRRDPDHAHPEGCLGPRKNRQRLRPAHVRALPGETRALGFGPLLRRPPMTCHRDV